MLILFASHHGLLRDALRQHLNALSSDVRFLEADRFTEVVTFVPIRSAPDIILLDLQMPGMDGALGVTQVARAYPSSPIVVLSGQVSSSLLAMIVQAGARGIVPKTSSPAAFTEALRLVLAGEKYIPAETIADALNLHSTAVDSPNLRLPNQRLQKLTIREREVLDCIVNGKSNTAIADILGVPVSSINIHVRNAYKKMGVEGRAEAVRVALRSV